MFVIIVNQILKMLLLLLLGCLCFRMRLIDENGSKVLANLPVSYTHLTLPTTERV